MVNSDHCVFPVPPEKVERNPINRQDLQAGELWEKRCAGMHRKPLNLSPEARMYLNMGTHSTCHPQLWGVFMLALALVSIVDRDFRGLARYRVA